MTDPTARAVAQALRVRPRRSARQRTVEKGRAAVAMARRILERQRGALWIETAPNVVRWITPRDSAGRPVDGPRIPISTRHDFCGMWDAFCVEIGHARPEGAEFRIVYFVQVTEASNMSARRAKILASGFPCAARDLLMGYRGRGVFRVLCGPRFDGEAEEWKTSRSRAQSTAQ